MTKTITLPLPPRQLHAHSKGHWREKTAATKRYRELAFATASEARSRRMEKARLEAVFFWPDRRTRDNFNAAHSVKPAIDGCVDAGIISDDKWTVLQPCSVMSRVDRDNPRVELTFVEVTQ